MIFSDGCKILYGDVFKIVLKRKVRYRVININNKGRVKKKILVNSLRLGRKVIYFLFYV